MEIIKNRYSLDDAFRAAHASTVAEAKRIVNGADKECYSSEELREIIDATLCIIDSNEFHAEQARDKAAEDLDYARLFDEPASKKEKLSKTYEAAVKRYHATKKKCAASRQLLVDMLAAIAEEE